MSSQQFEASDLDRILVRGFSISSDDERRRQATGFLQSLGLIELSEQWLYRCVKTTDEDYRDLYSEELRCEGVLRARAPRGERDCPECGRRIDLEKKTGELYIVVEHILWDKIADKVFEQAELDIRQASPGMYVTDMGNDVSVSIAFPETIGRNEFFSYDAMGGNLLAITRLAGASEYVSVISPGEALLVPDRLRNKVQQVCWMPPVVGVEKSPLFCALDELDGDRDWRFFETELIPFFLEWAQEAAEKLRLYLNQLWQNRRTIAGSLVVRVGGARHPDIRLIPKWEYLEKVFLNNQIFDTKCYRVSRAVSSREFDQAVAHRLLAPGNPESMIIITKTDRVTVWEDVVALSERDGIWPIVIIPKKLLVELARVVEADEAMEHMIRRYLRDLSLEDEVEANM